MLIVGVSTRCFRDDAALVVLLIHGGMCTKVNIIEPIKVSLIPTLLEKH